jgi:hypothetical protein
MDIEKAALAKYPAIVVEDFIGNYQREARLRGDCRESPRLLDLWYLNRERNATLLDFSCIPKRNHFTSGA